MKSMTKRVESIEDAIDGFSPSDAVSFLKHYTKALRQYANFGDEKQFGPIASEIEGFLQYHVDMPKSDETQEN